MVEGNERSSLEILVFTGHDVSHTLFGISLSFATQANSRPKEEKWGQEGEANARHRHVVRPVVNSNSLSRQQLWGDKPATQRWLIEMPILLLS